MNICRLNFSDFLRVAGEKCKLNVLLVEDKIKVLKFLDENKLKKEIAAFFY